MKKKVIIFLIIAAAVIAYRPVVTHFTTENLGSGVMILGTTGELKATGLLEHIHPDFKKQTGIDVQVTAEAADAVVEKAQLGKVEAVLLSSEKLEKDLVDSRFGINRTKVFAAGPVAVYHITAVNPDENPQVNSENVKKYIDWITSESIQKKIGEYKKEGAALFTPEAEKKQEPATGPAS